MVSSLILLILKNYAFNLLKSNLYSVANLGFPSNIDTLNEKDGYMICMWTELINKIKQIRLVKAEKSSWNWVETENSLRKMG